MPRRAASVTQADVARIVRGMRDAGMRNVRTVIRSDGVYIEADERVREPDDGPLDRSIAEAERIVPL